MEYGSTMNEYVDEQEHYCFLRMEELRLETGWFSVLQQLPAGSDVDVSGITSDGRRFVAELKSRRFCLRDGSVYDRDKDREYDSIMIEDHKYISLMTYMYEGFVPLYISFLEGGDAIVHNLCRITKRPKRIHSLTWSPSHKANEYNTKMLLPISDGAIFKTK